MEGISETQHVMRFHLRWAIWLCWGALVFHLHAQALPEWLSRNAGAKPPPVFGVMDESHFFKNPSTLKRISEQLRKLDTDRGYQIFLVVEPVLIATTPSELAAELRQSWVPKGNGMVLVFEADSRQLGIGRDLTLQPGSAENAVRVPSHETTAILARASELTDSKLAPEPYLEALVTNLVREQEEYFARRAQSPPPERSMKLGLLVLGTLALLSLAAIAVGALVRHSGMTAAQQYRFPVVDRPERLGAPCGASVTTRRFAKTTIPKA